MKQTPESILSVIDIMSAKIAEIIAQDKNLSNNDAIKLFLSTKTYQLLHNQKSKLYAESVEYIVDMLEAEWSNDMGRFLEI